MTPAAPRRYLRGGVWLADDPGPEHPEVLRYRQERAAREIESAHERPRPAPVAVRCVCWHLPDGSHVEGCPAVDTGDLLPPWRWQAETFSQYAGEDSNGKKRFEKVTTRRLVPPAESPMVITVITAEAPAVMLESCEPELVCVLDIESTGLKRGMDGSRITEIAMAVVDLRTGAIVRKGSRLLDPGVPVPAEITRLTGINDAMCAGQMRFAEAWPRILSFVGDLPVIAHNASFDRGQIEDSMMREGQLVTDWPRWRWFCSMAIARRVVPGFLTYSLHDGDKGAGLATRLKLPHQQAHRAMGDVLTTCALLVELRRRAAQPWSAWAGDAHGWGRGVEKPAKSGKGAKPGPARASAKKGHDVNQGPDLFAKVSA